MNNPNQPTDPHSNRGRRPGGGGGNRPPRRGDTGPKDGMKEKVLDMRRVTRVVAGGKRFRFRATVVVGDERGRVGIGVAKGLDVAQAVAKARTKASRSVVMIPLKYGRTIPHEVLAKYSAAQVLLKPAAAGRGLRAGGAVRSVLALAGVKDATAKCLGRTPNKLTNAWATLVALRSLKTEPPRSRVERRETAGQPQT